jgi:hypothetical protein
MLINYESFLEKKAFNQVAAGFEAEIEMYPLFDYQEAITHWACARGKAAIFADTGLGKTLMQLAWAAEVVRETDGKVLILAPLAVKEQTANEARKFNIPLDGIEIENYEQLHNLDTDSYIGVVLDESSILKNADGKTKMSIIAAFRETPYKLSCTATPSPNDFMELGTQAEFLGIMSQVEMLAMFFVHDGSDTSKWRLKGHGKQKFFEWLATWAIFITKPSDIGFDDRGHELPELCFHEHVIESGITDGLFAPIAQGLLDRNRARKDTVDARVQEGSMIANGIESQVIVWCHLNDESDKLDNLIHDSVEVKGSDSNEHKLKSVVGFVGGSIKVLISKPKMFGYGLNLQNCNHMVFVGLSDSWEQFYQAVRRCWRYGQKKPVHVHIISADVEGAVLLNIKRKEMQHKELTAEMIAIMKDKTLAQLGKAKQEKTLYSHKQKLELPTWA